MRFGIFALIAAAALGYMTYVEGVLAMKSSEVPEEITLKKLIARGPDGNAHIIPDRFRHLPKFRDGIENQQRPMDQRVGSRRYRSMR